MTREFSVFCHLLRWKSAPQDATAHRFNGV
jgi:hypothetical protein